MNPSIIQDILSEFKEQKIIVEKDRSYEIAHDILAARVNELRITEDNNRLRATRMVYETKENRGFLNEEQLAFIEPYASKLAFGDEDKDGLYRYIDDCKKRIKNEKEEELQRVAAEAKLKQSAEASSRKALNRRNMTVIFGVIGIVFATIATVYFLRHKKNTIVIFKRDAQESLAFQQYDRAYKAIIGIEEARKLVPPMVLRSDTLVRAINKLRQTLLFHVTSTNIKAQPSYIFYKSGNGVIGKKPVNSLEDDSNAFFFNGEFPNLSSIGFSTNTDHFFIAELIGNSKHLLKVFTIRQNGTITSKVVGVVETAAADFDPDGNLFYLSKDTIWQHNVAGRTQFIKKLNVLKTGKATALSFIKTRTNAKSGKRLSDYCLVSMEDSIFVFNRNTFRFLSLPAKSTLDIDSNRYLIYCYENRGEWSPLYRIDLNSSNLQRNEVPAKVTDDFVGNFSRFVIPFKHEDARPPVVQSPNGTKAIYYDSARSTFFARDSKSKFPLTQSKTEIINGYEALNDFFVYVCDGMKDKYQTVYMQRYSSEAPRKFTVPANWKFLEFKDKKYMLFRYIDEAKNLELQSLLIMDPYMVEDDYLERWFRKG